MNGQPNLTDTIAECPACLGRGKVGPFWTSLESADLIERMSEREKDRLRIVCPVCGGSGRETAHG